MGRKERSENKASGTPASRPADDPDTFVKHIHALVRDRLGGQLDEGSLERLTGGASQETWAFAMQSPSRGTVRLILRRVPTGVALADVGIGPEREAWLIQRAGTGEVPVPDVIHVLEPSDQLGRGFISARVDGETLAIRINRDEQFAAVRPHLAQQCGTVLAGIHTIDLSDAPDLPYRPAKVQLLDLQQMHRNAPVRSPIFELSLRWLSLNLPEDSGVPRLVHGDFRNGNLIIGTDGVRAVLDWELAHIGDPVEDIAYITLNSWRFGTIDKPVGGFGEYEQLLDGYVASGLPRPPHAAIRFWQIMGSLRWGLVCWEMARPPEPGAAITVERAMIGRRASEVELDLLDLLAGDEFV